MPKKHRVRPGECILSIAAREGFFWETIWNDSANADLKARRRDPEVLLPGDVVVIPDKLLGEETGDTETRHRFRKKGTPAKLRLLVERDDQPVRDADYVLVVDGVSSLGTTDGDGYLEASIQPDARQARLEIDGLVYELEFGGMDPIEEDTGVQTRLQNLGFYDGTVDGEMGVRTQDAVAEFQALMGLEPTGTIDEETRNRLFGRQDETHEALWDESASEDDPAAASTEEVVDDEDINDGDESVDDDGAPFDGDDSDAAGEEEIDIPDDEEDDTAG